MLEHENVWQVSYLKDSQHIKNARVAEKKPIQLAVEEETCAI